MNTKITDDVIEDAEAAGLFSKLTREGFTSDYIKALQRFAQLQRQREQVGEAVFQVRQFNQSAKMLYWKDVDYSNFLTHPSKEKRVLYKRPPPAVIAITPPSPSRELLDGLRKFLADNDTTEFGCACLPDRICGTCQWSKRLEPIRALMLEESTHEH